MSSRVQQLRELSERAVTVALARAARFSPFIDRMYRKALHRYWRRPGGQSNRPELYLSAEARSLFLLELVRPLITPEDPILEIGCNVGRNLHYLHRASYRKLTGIEISADAVALMRRSYPELARTITIHNAPVEDVIKRFEDGAFGLVFTMAVLEHIHPRSEWVFSEMVRIAGKYLLVIEDELGTTWRHFPRKYREVFEALGMQQIAATPCEAVEGLGRSFTARVFVRTRSQP